MLKLNALKKKVSAMLCRQTKTLMPDYTQDRLAPEVKSLVAGHLAQCRACAGEFSGVRESWETLGAFEPPPPSPYFLPKLHSRLATIPPRAKVFPSWAWAVALLAVAVISVTLMLRAPNPEYLNHSQASGYISLELGSHPELAIESLPEYLPAPDSESLPELEGDNAGAITLGTHELIIQMLE
jgi:hypothetical protein